jgi:hypothetical protein
MEPNQAYALIYNNIRELRCTAQEHELLDKALQVISQELEKAKHYDADRKGQAQTDKALGQIINE